MGREIRSQLLRATAYALVLEAMLAAAVLFWPEFRANIPAILRMVPGRVMGQMVDSIVKGGADTYVVLQHFFKGCHALGGAAAVLFAMGAVAGEAHRGTMEIWLARPLSRKRMLLERYTVGAFAVALPVFATSATIPWLLSRIHESARIAPWLLGSAHETLFLLAIYSTTFLLSTIGSRPTAIAFGMLLFLVAEFALYLVMQATHWSLYRLADVQDFMRILQTETLDARVCLPLVLVSGVCLAASLFAFERRVP
jgi:ABC-type transport system involved in multi-copper enzyme maturation permease subunit